MQTVLSDLSFKLDPGTVCVLLGPNGAGKSTLLNIIGGFLRPNAGTVHINDIDVTNWAPERLSHLGLRTVFQSTRLWESMSVFENLTTAFENSNERDADNVRRTLELSGLAPHADRLPGEISAGQRRILSIAMALVASPDVLLLDEPSATLDVNNSGRVFDYIRSIDYSSKVVLIVEHNLHLVSAFANAAIFLYNGQFVASGPYDEIVSRPDLRNLYLGLAH